MESHGTFSSASRIFATWRVADIDRLFRPFSSMARDHGGYTLDWRDAVYSDAEWMPVIFYEAHEDW